MTSPLKDVHVKALDALESATIPAPDALAIPTPLPKTDKPRSAVIVTLFEPSKEIPLPGLTANVVPVKEIPAPFP